MAAATVATTRPRELGNGELLDELYKERRARKPLVLFCSDPRNILSKEDREIIKTSTYRVLSSGGTSPWFTVVFAPPIRTEHTLLVGRTQSGEVKFFLA
jgi:hypothetical protein